MGRRQSLGVEGKRTGKLGDAVLSPGLWFPHLQNEVLTCSLLVAQEEKQF